MFGNLFGAIKNTHMAHKVNNILLRNYSISAPLEDVLEVLLRYPNDQNEHELAIWYLTDWVKRIYPNHPKAISEVTKYIRIAKTAAKNGFINNPACGDALFIVIENRFGVDASGVKID